MSIQGFDSLMNKLDKLSNSKKVITKSMNNIVKKVQGDAKDLAPVGTGQLRNSLFTSVEEVEGMITGKVYSNLPHAVYTEFGTGPVGEAAQKDLPANIASSIKYKQDMWWIHESQIDASLAEQYGFIKIETPDGIFYGTYGQTPKPYLYPALKQNQKHIKEALAASIRVEVLKKDD